MEGQRSGPGIQDGQREGNPTTQGSMYWENHNTACSPLGGTMQCPQESVKLIKGKPH